MVCMCALYCSHCILIKLCQWVSPSYCQLPEGVHWYVMKNQLNTSAAAPKSDWFYLHLKHGIWQPSIITKCFCFPAGSLHQLQERIGNLCSNRWPLQQKWNDKKKKMVSLPLLFCCCILVIFSNCFILRAQFNKQYGSFPLEVLILSFWIYSLFYKHILDYRKIPKLSVEVRIGHKSLGLEMLMFCFSPESWTNTLKSIRFILEN